MNYLFLDLIVAAVLLLCLFQGYRRGFVLTLCGFLAVFVALFGASFVSSTLAEPISQMIRPGLEESLSQKFQQSVENYDFDQPTGTDKAGISESFTEELDNLLGTLQDSPLYQSFRQALEHAIKDGVLSIAGDAAHSMAEYIALQIAKVVLFVLSFVLILILWRLLSHALNLACRLPVLSALNHWSGAIVGLLKGVVLLYIAAWLLKNSLLPPEVTDQTVLLRFFSSTNPFTLLAGVFMVK